MGAVMSKLLLDTYPLVVIPELAVKIGLHEAIIVQQMHYWLKINEAAGRNLEDGRYWTFGTYEDWQKQFPFWCEKTIFNLIQKLEKQGIVISGNYNGISIDRTKWYTLDYNKISI